MLQLVAVPYNLLLHKGTRESVGLDLTDQVVIIDEAHSESGPLILSFADVSFRSYRYHSPTSHSRVVRVDAMHGTRSASSLP